MAAIDQNGLKVQPILTAPSGDVCIPNISAAERQKRLNFGIVAGVVGVVLLVVLMATDTNRLIRLILFLPFAGATTGYFQWHDKTCVGLSRTNTRNINGTDEKIEDANELAQVKFQASRVQRKALIAAVPLTIIALILPML